MGEQPTNSRYERRLYEGKKNRAKDFEIRAKKNVETDIQKQKSQLKTKESQLERRLKEIDDDLKKKLDENEKFLLKRNPASTNLFWDNR